MSNVDEMQSKGIADFLKKSIGASKKPSAGKLNEKSSVVDFLKMVGRKAGVSDTASTFAFRKHLFETYDFGQGDEEYKGTAKQNQHLLSTLKKEWEADKKGLIGVFKEAADEHEPERSKKAESDDEDDEIMKQNGLDIDPVDMQDGTYDSYAKSIKANGGGPSFASYKKAKSTGMLS